MLPVLYELDSKEQLRVWSIETINKGSYSEIVITSGLDKGKKVVKNIKITSGKNIGKTNETSHYEQALLDSKSKWNNKIKSGYSTNRFSNETQISFPMLAKEFLKNKSKVIYPCIGQPKIDGVRCIYKNGELFSRTGKKFFNMEHILKELKVFGNDIIDGELYSYEMNFNKLVGLVKSETLSLSQKEEQKNIIFIIYDKINNMDYSQRFSSLTATIRSNNFKYITLIRNEEINYEEEVLKYHNVFTSEGYEGIMIRNKRGRYEEKKRSNNLLKYKTFIDDEFKITGFTSEKVIENGKELDLVIWICETEDHDTFSVRPKNNFEERAKIFKEADKYIGKYLNVRYQELTPAKIPRFPVGICIRDFE